MMEKAKVKMMQTTPRKPTPMRYPKKSTSHLVDIQTQTKQRRLQMVTKRMEKQQKRVQQQAKRRKRKRRLAEVEVLEAAVANRSRSLSKTTATSARWAIGQPSRIHDRMRTSAFQSVNSISTVTIQLDRLWNMLVGMHSGLRQQRSESLSGFLHMIMRKSAGLASAIDRLGSMFSRM